MADKPRILFVAHNSVLSPSFGGVEAYINTLSKYLANDYEVYWYVPYSGNDGVGIQLIGPDRGTIQRILLSTPFENWQLSCLEREDAFKEVLRDLNIQLVHFHHLVGHPPSLVQAANEFGARTIFTFHDFYSLCHISNLIDFQGKYCHPDKISLSSCDVCLNKKYSILPGSQELRREYWNKLFTSIDALIFNTKGGFELVSKLYSGVASHSEVVILPVAIEGFGRQKLSPKDNNELRVAILGNLNQHKGADVIIEAIEQLGDENISFHFFGEIEESYDERLASIKDSKVHRYGRYSSGKFPRELFECDISLHMSIWPETYVLSLSEAWAAGLFPIVSDIGALGERVTDRVNGLKITVGSSAALKKAILDFRIDPQLINKLRMQNVELLINWVGPHVIELKYFYKKLFEEEKFLKKTRHSNSLTNKKPLVWAKFNNTPHKQMSRSVLIFQRIKRFILFD